MRYLSILLILSIAFQGIQSQSQCYPTWQATQSPLFFQCIAPSGYSYNNNTTSYPSMQACVMANRFGCYKQGMIYYPLCKEGYTLTEPNVCTAQCPSGYFGSKVNNFYICSKQK